MRYEFQPPGEVRGGPAFYDPDASPPAGPYIPFGHALKSRPDRRPDLPIPPPQRVVDLGCGAKKEPGSLGVDAAKVSGVDVVADLFHLPFPFREGSVDMVFAHEFLEHVPHRLGDRPSDGLLQVMEEVHRILRPGGIFRLDVPHGYYDATLIDPTHTRAFLPQTFNYLEPESGLGFYTRSKYRVLALRIEWVCVKRRFKDYHVTKHLRSPFARKVVRRFLGPEPGYLHVILQKLPGGLGP